MRYLTLYLHFLRYSASRALEFRLDFFFRVVMDLIYYAVSLAFFTVIYGQTPLLGGWNLDQIYLFVCAYLLSDALFMTIFSNNLWWLPLFINKGDLDYYLVRPVSSLYFLSLRDFAANSFLNLLAAAGLVVWAVARYPGELGAGRLAVYVLLIFLGTFLVYLNRLMFVLPVFWIHSSHGLLEVSWSLTHLGERPVTIYRSWLRLALLTVVPLGFMAWVPAAALFSGPGWGPIWRLLLHAAAVTAGLSALVAWLWRRGLAAYSSASS